MVIQQARFIGHLGEYQVFSFAEVPFGPVDQLVISAGFPADLFTQAHVCPVESPQLVGGARNGIGYPQIHGYQEGDPLELIFQVPDYCRSGGKSEFDVVIVANTVLRHHVTPAQTVVRTAGFFIVPVEGFIITVRDTVDTVSLEVDTGTAVTAAKP